MAFLKKNDHCVILLTVLLTVFTLGCNETGSQNGNSLFNAPDSDFSIPYDLHPLRAAVPAGFIRAADISHCLEIEQHGGVYRNFDGNAGDIVDILAGSGINHARIRVWVDPDKNPDHYAGDGNCTAVVAKQIAVRAKAAGMGIMIDFHYSDWWANPGRQEIPFLWKDIPTKQGLIDALYAYTKETIEAFIAAGAAPDTVKIGNEISGGLLSQHRGGSANGTGYRLNGWQDYSDALKAAAQAVRDTAPDAKIVIHLGDGGVGSIVNIFANFTKQADGQPAVFTEVDYDILGLSWYPIWQEHLSIDALYFNIINLKQTFGKDVLLCETGYQWTSENWDSFGNFTDSFHEEAAYRLLTNSNGFVSDSAIAYGYRQNGTTRYIPSNPESQARVIRAIMDAVVSAGGMGVMWWGADWIAPVPGLRSNAEMGALFDNKGKALPAMKVLGGISGSDEAKPGAVTGFNCSASGDTVILNWTRVNNAIASIYQLDRALKKEGPWTTVNDNLTGDSYGDMGLRAESAYFYRIRAFNKNGWGDFCDPLEAGTLSFKFETPSGLRVRETTSSSVSLVWDAVTSAASYKLYGAKSINDSRPADSSYSQAADIIGTAYTHSELLNGETWWYKISAVTVNRGEGPKSDPVSVTVGSELDFKAFINMVSAGLDADFLDPLKASNSADCSIIMKTDNSNYQIEKIYAANDSDYLYIALDYGARPSMWQNDWITVWIDNTNSTAAGAATGGNFRIAQNQTINPESTIEFSFSHRQNIVTPASVTKNSTWVNSGDNLFAPDTGCSVIKYRIPLAGISGAVKNDTLRIIVSNTQGWSNGSRPVVGCVVPAGAVTGAFADNDVININMENALSYTVK